MRKVFTDNYQKLLTEAGPLAVFDALNEENVLVKNIRVYGWEDEGRSSYDHLLISSASKYLFEDLSIIDAYIPQELENRPGIKKPSTKYITIHDTAAARTSSGAVAHMRYVTNGGGGTSWHYTVGNDGIFHHLPNNEVAYHAGDGSRFYELFDTGIVKTTDDVDIDITLDGYYAINGIKSLILAPTDEDGNILSKDKINNQGIEVVIGNDNHYYLGTTWYSKTYKLIGNGGGNRNSIGIESCIDKGSDIYLTWQRLAKLVAFLLEEQSLNLDAVVGHHYFSGKDCPKTMLHAKMWNNFLELVEAEYFVRTQMIDYKIEFIPKSPIFADNGRIKFEDKDNLLHEYELKITDRDGKIYTKTYSVSF